MYKSQLDTLLKKTAPRASLLYGESEFLIDYYSKKIAHNIATHSEEKTTFYFDEYQFESVNTLLSQGSLFGGQSLVVIKTTQKLPKEEVQSFLKSIARYPQNALIIEYYASSSKSLGEYAKDCKAFAASFKNPGLKGNTIAEVRFFTPQLDECKMLLQEKAKELGLIIDDRLLSHILSLHNNDIGIASKELEKFVIYKTDQQPKIIELGDINVLCDGVASFSIEELNYAIMDKKPFLEILHAIYEEGVNEIMMIGEIQRFFYQLFLFFAYIKIHGKADATEILGFNPPQQIVQRLSRYCIRLKEQDYAHIFEILSQWRYDVSKGRSKQSYNALIKIQALIR